MNALWKMLFLARMHECRPEVACTQTLPLSHYQLRIINRARLALFPRLTPSRHAVITQSKAHTASTCPTCTQSLSVSPSWKDACFIMLGSNGTNIWHSLFGLKKSPAGQRESSSQKWSDLISAKSCCKYLLFSCEEERASFWQDSTIYSLVIQHQHHDFGT